MKSSLNLFATIFLPVLLILAFGSAIIYEANMELIRSREYKTIKDEWQLISHIDRKNISSKETHERFALISNEIGARITFINSTGKVLLDTAVNYDEIKNLDNHALREEVRNARHDIDTVSTRKSDSTAINTTYYAKKIDGDMVMRIAYNSALMTDALTDARNKIMLQFLAIAFFIAIAIVIIARKLSSPIKKLDEILDDVKNGKADFRFAEFSDKTIDKISSTIYEINSSFIRQNTLLRQEKEKMNTMLSSMDEAIILMKRAGQLIHFNSRAKEYLNIDLNDKINLLRDIHDIELINFFNDAVLIENEAKRKAVYKNSTFDLYVKMVDDEALIVFREITDKAHYETFKTELVGNITHELKTPLALLIGCSETILADPDIDNASRDKFLSQINRNAHRLNNIINDTLELHQLEYENEFTAIDKAADISELKDELQTLIKANSEIELIYNTSQNELPTRYSDILSILTNLISNAIKYSNGSKIKIELRQYLNDIVIKVSDEGPVIPKTERERIFERFYTVSKSRSKDRSGTGLGLSIVKHIAMQYFGKVSLYENEQQGNTFEVILKAKTIKTI